MASILGAGIGAFAMGLFVVLNEADIFVAPTLYPPAGGVTGRTTLAVVVWLLSWVVLHRVWKGRELKGGLVYTATLILIVLGILGTFPPAWKLL
jgi:hypothetical protein